MCDLTAPEFTDEEIARTKVEEGRWPNGPVCPHCDGTERNYSIAADAAKKIRVGLYKCGDCDGQFTVKVGTVFEGSKVPLSKWLLAIHLMCASKKGMSSKQLERILGVTYKTAWFMSHRIREAMRDDGPGVMGGNGKTVEVDETFGDNKKPRGHRKGRGYAHKKLILSLVERDGRARSFHVPAVNAKTLRPILKEQIAADTRVMTDDAGQYSGTKEPMTAHFQEHGVVKHSIGEYIRGDIHTNTIESYFAIMKRGLVGTFHLVSPQHLKRYLGEFDFRYNYREKTGYDDRERARIALMGIEGERLMYRDSGSAQG